MKFSKLLSFALVSLGVAFVSSACSWFDSSSEEAISEFYQPDDGVGKGAKGLHEGEDEVSLNPFEGKEGDGSVGAWSDKALTDGDGDFGGFGTRIEGVDFEPVYFLFDQNNVTASEEWKVLKAVDFLKSNPDARIVITGNCDERGTTEYNRGLGEKRAIAAKNIMLSAGIDESRIKTISYGEERPAAPGASEESYRLNRRDELIPVKRISE